MDDLLAVITQGSAGRFQGTRAAVEIISRRMESALKAAASSEFEKV
jgi:hypothetical protein